MASIINANCPECGRDTLEVKVESWNAAAGEDFGEIYCFNPKCSRPRAATEILGDVQLTEEALERLGAAPKR